jgi:tRNA(fMet)-specific endonuclease VapC
MILVDTDIIIEVFRGNQAISTIISGFAARELAVSSVTVMELYVGARDKTELASLSQYLKSFSLFHVSNEISSQAMALIHQFAFSHRLSVPDALIAATAIQHGATFFTRNKKHFSPIRELSLYTY